MGLQRELPLVAPHKLRYVAAAVKLKGQPRLIATRGGWLELVLAL
eukprot:SAG11_NODE_1577_length_4652_cov_12.631013_7_plen_45_part_00